MDTARPRPRPDALGSVVPAVETRPEPMRMSGAPRTGSRAVSSRAAHRPKGNCPVRTAVRARNLPLWSERRLCPGQEDNADRAGLGRGEGPPLPGGVHRVFVAGGGKDLDMPPPELVYSGRCGRRLAVSPSNGGIKGASQQRGWVMYTTPIIPPASFFLSGRRSVVRRLAALPAAPAPMSSISFRAEFSHPMIPAYTLGVDAAAISHRVR